MVKSIKVLNLVKNESEAAEIDAKSVLQVDEKRNLICCSCAKVNAISLNEVNE